MHKNSGTEPLQIVDIIIEGDVRESLERDRFELVYIHYGNGTHTFDDRTVEYEKGDLFVSTPGERHHFATESVTRFTFIKFTPGYFDFHAGTAKKTISETAPAYLIQTQWSKQDKITVKEPCQTILKNVFENIVLYNSDINVVRSHIVYYHILSVFGMIKEYMEARNIVAKESAPNNAYIAAYIQENVYCRELISVKAISTHFNIAPAYFSTYFKRNFGTGYKEYTEKLQIQLIKQRLSAKDVKLKQIADEFGFADLSHLSKFFKRHEGISPREYTSCRYSPQNRNEA